MKLTLITAIVLAPLAALAADKEVQTPTKAKVVACQKCHRQQVALFVQGSGVATSTIPPTASVTSAQTGQGVTITFFTGSR